MSNPGPDNIEATGASAELEMASVLFMDIVGYSLEPMERQSSLLRKLQEIVRQTPEFRRGQEKNELISLPTGDGMALVFFANPVVPVECALKVGKALKEYPDMRMRIGVHTGPVYRVADINASMNVAGGGINMAQRVMDCGDAGHILLSKAVADILGHLSGWPQYLTDLGEVSVKHGVKIHLYSLATEEAGSREIPSRLRPKQVVKEVSGRGNRSVLVAGVCVLAVAGIAGVGWQSGWFRPARVEPPLVVLPERELRYWVIVQKYRDGKPFQAPFRLANDINFEANYRIRLGFRIPQAGNFYVVNEGPERVNGMPDYNVLFPSPAMNDSSPQVKENAEVLIGYLRLDEQQGTEKLWMVWSKDDLPELASARMAANFEQGGSIRDRQKASDLERFLAEHSKNRPQLEQLESEKTTVLRVKGDVLVYLRKLEHH